MKKIIKTTILVIITLIIIASAYPLLGCCEGCCEGCGGGNEGSSGSSNNYYGDYSTDSNKDNPENVPTNLGETQYNQQQYQRTPGVCDGINTNSIDATASKSATESGYSYSYSFTIKACASTLGYSVVLDGPAPNRIESGVANKDKETTRSGSHSSTESYTQLCIKTGDSSIGDYCVPFT